jgi:protoheme IX farnesyltransferase
MLRTSGDVSSTTLPVNTLPAAASTGLRARLSAYLELTKPGIVRMVLVTAGAGFFMGSNGFLRPVAMLWMLLGTGLAAAGACGLNEYLERHQDARMRRTASRPLPAGLLGPREALGFASTLALLGVAVLAWQANLLTAALVAGTVISYLFAYTPLKRVHWTATLVGAVPGALPILAGWTAAGGTLGARGLALFAILFFWQMPHFFALAWMYRDDYRRGGFHMLTEHDRSGTRTARQIVVWALALVAVSTLPTVSGLTGQAYAVAALLLGLAFLAPALALLRRPSDAGALRVFLASVIYLPVLLLVMVFERLLA